MESALLSNLPQAGAVIISPGGSFHYLVVGPCCQLFDRDSLPYLLCSIGRYKGKSPSWNRVGKRFVPDRSVSKRASYNLLLINPATLEPLEDEPEVRIYWKELSKEQQAWWYSKRTPANLKEWAVA